MLFIKGAKRRKQELDYHTVRVCVAHLYLRYRMIGKAHGRFSTEGLHAWNALQTTKEILNF